jgi:hypothetical protein
MSEEKMDNENWDYGNPGFPAGYSQVADAQYAQDPYAQGAYDEGDNDEQYLGYSEGKPKEGLYALFDKVLNLPKSTKVGNVDKLELGSLGISIRESLRVALIGRTFGHPIFAEFFANQSNIITDTSMAKRGWLAELFVTSKKFTEKAASAYALPASVPTPDSSKKVAGFFGGKK